LPAATAIHTPALLTCNATARPDLTGANFKLAVPVVACIRVVGMTREAVCATTDSVLVGLTYWARTFPATVSCGANARTAYDPTAGARKLVAYEPVLEVVALTRVTQLVPDPRCTHTGREYTPGSLPVTFTVSAAMAVEATSKMYGAWVETIRDGDATAAAPCQDDATAR
jgi:hypothetical protein